MDNRKDIFIDNCIAVKFLNPPDQEIKDLIYWFQNDIESCLVVSNKLLNEYNRSCNAKSNQNSILIIITNLLNNGRLIKIPNEEIKDFKIKYFKKKVIKKLRSNKNDHDHIPVVLLSCRKIALTEDINLTDDLLNFPKFNCVVSNCPSKIDYK